MKKNYVKPTMQEMFVNCGQLVMASSNEVTNTNGNSGINYGGGGNGPAYSRRGGWDDDEE